MHFGFESMTYTEKTKMRELGIRGGPYTKLEMAALLDYCQSDVDALDKLLPAMMPKIDFPRAVLRGRYMKAVARMETTGVPIDVEMLSVFRCYWGSIKRRLITAVDSDFGVYDGTTFKIDQFASYLERNNLPWPMDHNGRLLVDADTFKEQVKAYPEVSPLRELRHSLSGLRLEKLTVGTDGRNRANLRPFASRSGRNQPSNSKFIFGASVWLRGLIRPGPGRAVAYVDWSQTVFGWTIHTVGGDNPRSLANFPLQANAAEMMRLACCLATEAGINVCCPIHDAILVESSIEDIDEVVNATQSYMQEASRIVLDGFKLESDAKIVRSPDRYMDEDRGRVVWNKVTALIAEAEHSARSSRHVLSRDTA